MGPDLRPVILDRAPGPLIEPQVNRLDTDLLGDERHRLIRQLPAAAGKPAAADVELQQQHEPQPGRPALAGHQLALVIEQDPVLDQLLEIHRPSHGRPSFRRRTITDSPADTRFSRSTMADDVRPGCAETE